MADFPEITPNEPVIKPAQSEKVFNKLWMRKLEVFADGPSIPVRIVIELVPSTGSEILNENIIRNVIPDAFGLAAEDPEFAQALGAVIAMANKYKNHVFEQPQ